MHIVTVDEMRQLERKAESEYGLTSSILMEHAGMSAAEILTHHISRQHTLKEREFLILVGPGNNGGDGMVMGRNLQKWGGIVSYFHWKEQHLTAGEQDVPEQETAAKLEEAFSHADYIIDALLGTGRSRPLPDSMRDLLARAKQERESRDAVRIVAVDLPTGVNADTGEVDPGTISRRSHDYTRLPQTRLLLLPRSQLYRRTVRRRHRLPAGIGAGVTERDADRQTGEAIAASPPAR